MATGDRARKRKWLEKKHSYTRRTGFRGRPFKRLLIVCEGGKTEPNYFRQFKATAADIKIVGTGYNTMSLVKEALELKKEAKKKNAPYDEIWCVFDRDSFPADNVDNAWQTAKKKKLKTALSNEAFELWFLLHFDYIDAALSRNQYQEMLTTRIGRVYQKNDPNIYLDLLSKQDVAIANAKRLLTKYNPRQPAKDNPCTEVHNLVIELNKQK
jgi:hypothetical protein